jgi:protease-4
VTDVVEALDRARTDPRITGLELRVSESTMQMGKTQDVREKIREFNRAGKFSVAYLEFATNSSYYLASACQTLILLPKSSLYVHGMMAATTFLRGTLDKLGIYPDLFHIGDYKNAMNIYTEKKYTPAHREATQALLGEWYQEYLQGVAEARGLNRAEVEKLISQGPFTSEEALAAKLVDRVAYRDQAFDFIREKNRGSEHRLDLRAYLARTNRQARTRLAVIYATGTILPGESGDTPFGVKVMGSDTIAEQFRRAREDNSVKAVVLRIDSPGGVAFSSEAIRREVEITKRQKPVVVSMSDVAASGGYWIALSANQIVAEPGTITGSIGVVAGKFNLRGLYAKLGLTNDLVTTTENSTLDWPFQNFTPTQRESVQKDMRDVYNHFLAGVAEGRRMKVEDVDKIAQGRVWSGEHARRLGLVDELGGLHTAIACARKLARISPEEKVSLLLLPPRRSLLEKVLDLAAGEESPLGMLSPRAWLQRLDSVAAQQVWTLLPAVPHVQ